MFYLYFHPQLRGLPQAAAGPTQVPFPKPWELPAVGKEALPRAGEHKYLCTCSPLPAAATETQILSLPLFSSPARGWLSLELQR